MSPGGTAQADDRAMAFIDLGTNSIRLLVVRLNELGAFAVLSEQKETVRLGEGEFGTDLLADAAMDRAVIVAGRFAELARSFGAEEIVAVATSAAREARNRGVLLSRLQAEAGLDVHVIPGLEEARLIYLGVSSGLALGDRAALFVDIGGGSTEMAVGTAKTHTFLSSVKLGSLRLLNLFPPRGPGGAYDVTGYGEMREYLPIGSTPDPRGALPATDGRLSSGHPGRSRPWPMSPGGWLGDRCPGMPPSSRRPG